MRRVTTALLIATLFTSQAVAQDTPEINVDLTPIYDQLGHWVTALAPYVGVGLGIAVVSAIGLVIMRQINLRIKS